MYLAKKQPPPPPLTTQEYRRYWGSSCKEPSLHNRPPLSPQVPDKNLSWMFPLLLYQLNIIPKFRTEYVVPTRENFLHRITGQNFACRKKDYIGVKISARFLTLG